MKNKEEEMLKCPLCGHEFPSSTAEDSYMDGESVLICHACMIGNTNVCEHCGDRHPYSELHTTEYGTWVCDDCVENGEYIYCEHCENYAPRCSSVLFRNEWWGVKCAYNNLARCDECGDWTMRNESYSAANGHILCQSCYEEDYVTCEGCGDIIRYDDAVSVNDDYYCESCADHSYGVYDYHNFNYSEYRNNKKKTDGENDDLYLGIELECDCGCFNIHDFEKYKEIHFEHDSSLSSRGVEMISLPMTLRYHQQFKWKEILSLLLNQDFKSHDASDCGLHVHMSRYAIPATTIAKMDVFINRAKEFWTLIARRDEVYCGEYNDRKELDLTRCLYKTTSRCPIKMAGKLNYGMGYERYTPVNVCNNSTVEIRIFRGTLKYQTFIGSIEICHAVVNWLNTVPVTRIYDTEKLTREFIEYIKHNSDRYPHVMPMLDVLLSGSRFERLIKENAVKKISQ